MVKRIIKIFSIILYIFLFLIIITMFVKAENLGVKKGQLAPCPSSPNCVSSQAEDEKHRIEPLPLKLSVQETMKDLKQIVNSMKRARIIKTTDNYIHAECKTFLGFTDDLEFYVDEKDKVIHVRSASRVGYSDLGVNHRRVEKIRKDLE
jgi:uncharacterized protein (DUF1499 family)